MEVPPTTISFGVQWSFAHPAPSDAKAFIEEVKNFNKKVVADAGLVAKAMNYLGRLALNEDTGLKRLRVKYEYAVESPNGEWKTLENVVEIQASSGTLKAGEILYWIHRKAQPHLAKQDHAWIEDLTLAEEAQTAEVPTYDLFLGS